MEQGLVVVIGAGVAGLQTVSALTKAGIPVTCLEQQDGVGGIWTRDTNGYTLQVPWELYQFPDFPFPEDLRPKRQNATSQELAAYLDAYASYCDLHKYIRLKSRVLHASYTAHNTADCNGARHTPWSIVYEDVDSKEQYVLRASWLVLCTGLMATPFMPQYKGQEQFQGQMLHSKDVKDCSGFQDKHVVVVGSSRTGLDLLAEMGAASQAKSMTLVYRTAHWCLPATMQGQDVSDFLFSHHTAKQLPPYYTHCNHEVTQHCSGSCLTCGGGTSVAASNPTDKHGSGFAMGMLSAKQAKFWRSVAAEARQQACQTAPPNLDLLQDLMNGAHIYDARWSAFLQQPNVQQRQGMVACMKPRSVVLLDGSELSCDVLLCCTGYHNSYRFLDPATLSALNVAPDGLSLYRGILPPNMPHLAFVGSEVSTFNQLLASFLQASWLVRMLTGRLPRRSALQMQADVMKQQEWRRRLMPAARNRSAVYMIYQQHYWDQLVSDMGAEVPSKPWWSMRARTHICQPVMYKQLLTTAPAAPAGSSTCPPAIEGKPVDKAAAVDTNSVAFGVAGHASPLPPAMTLRNLLQATGSAKAAAACPVNRTNIQGPAGLLTSRHAHSESGIFAATASAGNVHGSCCSIDHKGRYNSSTGASGPGNVWTAGALVQDPLGMSIGAASPRLGTCGPVAEGLENDASSSNAPLPARVEQTKAAAQQAQRAAEAFAAGSSTQAAKSSGSWTTGLRRWSHERFGKEKPAAASTATAAAASAAMAGDGAQNVVRGSLDTAKAQLEAAELAQLEASHHSGSSTGLAAVAEGEAVDGSPSDATPRAGGSFRHRISNSAVFKQLLGPRLSADQPSAQVSKAKQILKLFSGSGKGNKMATSGSLDSAEAANLPTARSLEATVGPVSSTGVAPTATATGTLAEPLKGLLQAKTAAQMPSSSAPADNQLLSSFLMHEAASVGSSGLLPLTSSRAPVHAQRAGSASDAAGDAGIASLYHAAEAGPQSITNVSVQDWVPQSRDMQGQGSKAALVTWRTGASADSHVHSSSSSGHHVVRAMGDGVLTVSGDSPAATPTMRGAQHTGTSSSTRLMSLAQPNSTLQANMHGNTGVVGSSGSGSSGFLMPLAPCMPAASGWWQAPIGGPPSRPAEADKAAGTGLEQRLSVRNRLQDMDEVVVQRPVFSPAQRSPLRHPEPTILESQSTAAAGGTGSSSSSSVVSNPMRTEDSLAGHAAAVGNELNTTQSSNLLRRLSGRLVSGTHASVISSHLLRLSDDPNHEATAGNTPTITNSHLTSQSSGNASHMVTANSELHLTQQAGVAVTAATTVGAASTTSGVHVSVGDTVPGPQFTSAAGNVAPSDVWAGEWSSVTSNVLQHLGVAKEDMGAPASMQPEETAQTAQSNVLRRLSWRLGQGGTNSALQSGQHAVDVVFGGFDTCDMASGADLPEAQMLMYHPLLSALMQARASAPTGTTHEHHSNTSLTELLSSDGAQGGTHSSNSDTDKVPPLPGSVTRSYLSLGAHSGGGSRALRTHTSPRRPSHQRGGGQHARFGQHAALLGSSSTGHMTGLHGRARSFSHMAAPLAPRSASALSSHSHGLGSRTIGGGIYAPRSASVGVSRLAGASSMSRLSAETSTYHLSPSMCDTPSHAPSRLMMQSCDGTAEGTDEFMSALMAASRPQGGRHPAAESGLGELLVCDYVLLLKELGVLDTAKTGAFPAAAQEGITNAAGGGPDAHAPGMHSWVPVMLHADHSHPAYVGGATSYSKAPTDSAMASLPPGIAIISETNGAQRFLISQQPSEEMESASNQLLRLSARVIPTCQHNILNASHQHAAITRLGDNSNDDLVAQSHQLLRLGGRVLPTTYNNVVDGAMQHVHAAKPSPDCSSDDWEVRSNMYMRLSARVMPTTDNNIAPTATAVIHDHPTRRSVDIVVGSLDHMLDSRDFARLSGRVLPSETGSIQMLPPRAAAAVHQQVHGSGDDHDADSLHAGGWAMPPVPANLLHHTPAAGGLRARLLAQRAEAMSTGTVGLGGLSGQMDVSTPESAASASSSGLGQNAERLRQRLCESLMARDVVRGLVRELNNLPDRVAAAAAAAHQEMDGISPSRPRTPDGSDQPSPGLDVLLGALQADINMLPQRLAAALLPPTTHVAQPRHLSPGCSSTGFAPLDMCASDADVCFPDSTHLFSRLEGRVNPATSSPMPSATSNVIVMEPSELRSEALYDASTAHSLPASYPASTILGHASTGSQLDKAAAGTGPAPAAATNILGSKPFGMILDDVAHLVSATAAMAAVERTSGESSNSVWADQVIVQLLLQDLVHLPDRLLAHTAARSVHQQSGLGDVSGPTIAPSSTRQLSAAAQGLDAPRVLSPGPMGSAGAVAAVAADDILGLLISATDNLLALSAWIGAQEGMPVSASVPPSVLGSNSGTSIQSKSQQRPPHLERLVGRVMPSQPGSRRASITMHTLLNGTGPA